MRVLTVRQPWAWSLIHGGKDVENRSRNIAGAYRGPVAIHVSLTDDDELLHYESEMAGLVYAPCPHERDMRHNSVTCVWCVDVESLRWQQQGEIIGVVDLWDVHKGYCDTDDYPICSAWAEFDQWHLAVQDPRSLAEPIPFKGGLGLRRLPDIITEQIEQQLALAEGNPS